MKDRFYSKTIGCIIAMLAIVLGISSCKDDFTTDNTSFALYYTSMTDIAPSMTGVIAKPTYKGAVPYDFKITGITYFYKDEEGEEVTESYTGDCFAINTENGEISINSTRDMKTGKYFISVSCYAAGTMYTFNNAVEVNFLKAVPEGIIVEPNFIEVKLADVKNKDSETVFPTAKVTTENSAEHITITGYKISNVVRLESDGSETIINNNKIELFTISDHGIISINKNSEDEYEDVKAGLYRIDLKLTTMASSNLGEEEGLFVDAMRINLSGAPTSISYELGAIETGKEGDETKPRGGFISSKPLIEGSPINAVYEITAIKKVQSSGGTLIDASDEEKAFFSIDEATGVVSVPNTHTFIKGDVYKVYVKVTNPEGDCTSTDDNALTLNVVEWVETLKDFTYEKNEMLQGMNFESGKAKYDVADSYVKYSFKSLPKGYEDYFSINAQTGEVKIEKYNTLPRTEEGKPFIVEVKAKNFKNEVTGKLEINVKENPNYFTYISYGNNLVEEQTPGSIYDNQYRFKSIDDVKAISLEPKTDINTNNGCTVKWKLANKHQGKNIKIDENTGVITAEKIEKGDWNSYAFPILFVTATVSSDGIGDFARTYPVFFNYSKPVSGVTIDYTPFVLRVNPKDGGSSSVPSIKGDNLDLSKVYLDFYCNNTCYYNLNGQKSDGTPLDEGRLDKTNSGTPDYSDFLRKLWDEYGKEAGNYGDNFPMSYYNGSNPKANFQNNLAYVNNGMGDDKFKYIVNPRKWNDDGWADGVFIGKFKFTINGTLPIPKDKSTYYIAIWFDKNYVQK